MTTFTTIFTSLRRQASQHLRAVTTSTHACRVASGCAASILAALLLAACVTETEPPTGLQKGTFSIGLAADSLTVEVETRAGHSFTTRAAVELTDAEAADFLVTLTENGETVWQQKTFSDITLADRTQPLGSGYTVTAENVTEAVAESANDGWGCRRYAGTSEPFAVVSGETTHVTVPCRMANAGLTVVFDQSFTDFFTDYAVTTDDRRALKFSSENLTTGSVSAGSAGGTSSSFPTAFYNIPSPASSLSIGVIITAAAGWDGSVRLTRNLNLQPGKTTRLNVRLNSTEPTEGNIGLSVTYDDTFDEGTSTELTLD